MTSIDEHTKLFRFDMFNFIKFKEFLVKNKAFATAASIVIATQINELAISLTDNMIVPIINRDYNKDGVADIKQFENTELIIFGIKFKIGKFIIDIIKFIMIIYLVFAISIFYDKVIDIQY